MSQALKHMLGGRKEDANPNKPILVFLALVSFGLCERSEHNARERGVLGDSSPNRAGRLCVSSNGAYIQLDEYDHCLLYTSPSPRDRTRSRMPSSA